MHNRELVLCIYLSLFACWSWWRWCLSGNSLYTTMLLHWKMSTLKKGGPMKPTNEFHSVVDRFGFSQCGREVVALVVLYSRLWNPKVSLGCMRLQPSRIHPLQTERVWQNQTIRYGWLPERVWYPLLSWFWHPLLLWHASLTAICWCWAVCSHSLVRQSVP